MEAKLDRIIELLEEIAASTRPKEVKLNFNQVLINHNDEEAVAKTVSEASARADVRAVRYRPRPS
jgi:hypothetical protein